MLVGYMRVSSDSDRQSTDLQRDALLAGTRVCVFPSEKEGWGLTVIEANALGTPVVARNAPGLRDSVRHDKTGILVSVDAGKPMTEETEAYAKAIGDLLDETEAAVALRRRCLDWAAHFDWNRATEQMEEAIEATLAETTP